MDEITPEQFQALLPLACAWAEEQENLIFRQGVRLTNSQLEDAKRVGVIYPERVRLFQVEKIPLPEHPDLRAAAEATRFISPYAEGLTLRYGIYIRTKYWGERRLIVHELIHTSQYEKLGGFHPFLQRYLLECLTLGYPNSPMEQEAIRFANEICGSF